MPRTRTRPAAAPVDGSAAPLRSKGAQDREQATLSPLLLWESGDSHCKVQSRELEATRRIMESGKARLTSRAMKGGHLTVWELPGTKADARAWLRALRLTAKTA
jgi:hypothetical protein